jgi:colanic acid/amylovoran biosynthesis protein
MKTNNKNIEIRIIGGNYIGKGAEAMMLVVRDQIIRRFPNANFWVTPISTDEAEKLKKDNFKLIYQKKGGRFIKLFQFLCGFFDIQRKTGLLAVQSGQNLINPFRATDAVIDISGFVSSDQLGSRAARGRLLNYMWAVYAGNKIVFMPQSWGPFQNKSVRRFTKWMLKKASLICAREKVSRQYLIDAGCANTSQVLHSYDIAFLFNVHEAGKTAQEILSSIGLKSHAKPFVTLTPNMRIYERVEGENAENRYIQNLIKIIHYFLDQTDHNIILVSHEASLNRRNDPELCVLLKKMAGNPDRVAMLTGNETAGQVKSIIGLSEFLVASRYHSLVAALSMRTPVAVIGWSHKYDELMQTVGLSDYIVDPVRKTENRDALEMIKKAYRQRQEIAHQLNEKLPLIENNVHIVFDRVAEILSR